MLTDLLIVDLPFQKVRSKKVCLVPKKLSCTYQAQDTQLQIASVKQHGTIFYKTMAGTGIYIFWSI